MKRHYFLSEDLDNLEAVEIELEKAGFDVEQIHVLSENDALLENRHLNAVDSFSRKDIVKSGLIGLMIGLVGAAIILFLSYQTGISESVTWAPAVFLSVVVLGFCTWEGGLWGIQKPNRDFEKFQNLLAEGKHLFFVDVREDQSEVFNSIMGNNPALTAAGSGDGASEWVVGAQKRWHRLLGWAP